MIKHAEGDGCRYCDLARIVSLLNEHDATFREAVLLAAQEVVREDTV